LRETPTNSTSLSFAKFGRWEATAQLPAPMTPTRIFGKVLPQSMDLDLLSEQNKEPMSYCQGSSHHQQLGEHDSIK
jgi:hypothetical protein